MKISSVSHQNFGTKLGGEISKVIEISMNAGASRSHVQKLLKEVCKICPQKDEVYFYFRKYQLPFRQEFRIRSGIRVIKNGIEKELNINPRNCTPKTLLDEMVEGVKKLVLGHAHSNSTHHAYKVGSKNSWLDTYKETPYHPL